MNDFVIMTDTDSEIPLWLKKDNDLPVFEMPYTIDGEEKNYDLGENTDYIDFFTQLQAGVEVTTSTRSPYDVEQFFREQLGKGLDILYLGFSSQLSAHFSICEGTKPAMEKDFPDRRIVMIDTMRISMPMGLLVIEAVDMKKSGKTMDEIIDWVQVNKLRAQGWFTVDDLMYLKRGGRISGTAAMIGTMMEVKPVLTLDDLGRIVVQEKIKGRKKVVQFLETMVEQNIGRPEESSVCILHANRLDTAKELEERLKAFGTFKRLWIQDVGPVIGAHTGPGLIAVTFIKKPLV